jgi:hypothetical protein
MWLLQLQQSLMNWLMFIRPWHDCHKNTETSQTLKGLKILALYDMYKHLYYIIHVWLWHDIIELKTQKHLTQQKYISSDRAQECFKLRYMTVIVTAMLNVSKISITIATQLHITRIIICVVSAIYRHAWFQYNKPFLLYLFSIYLYKWK